MKKFVCILALLTVFTTSFAGKCESPEAIKNLKDPTLQKNAEAYYQDNCIQPPPPPPPPPPKTTAPTLPTLPSTQQHAPQAMANESFTQMNHDVNQATNRAKTLPNQSNKFYPRLPTQHQMYLRLQPVKPMG